MEKFYTLQELSEILKISVVTLRYYAANGTIKAVKLGKHWRITEASLNEFVENELKKDRKEVKNIE